MVDLLAGHTSMTVRQATDGMSLERNHFYVADGSLGLKCHFPNFDAVEILVMVAGALLIVTLAFAT